MTDETKNMAKDRGARLAAEETSRASEERFDLIVDAVADYGIFLLDSTGVVKTWNSGAARLKGYAAEEIIGQHFSRFYPDKARAERWPEHELKLAARDGRFE